MNKRQPSVKKNSIVSFTDYQFLEFHRHAVALLPDVDDPRPGLAIIMPGKSRVHRIGQRRVVQVFKLVTQGTLEEKISAIIDRKRDLMDDVIKEDRAELLKTFNREDLLAMLTPEAF